LSLEGGHLCVHHTHLKCLTEQRPANVIVQELVMQRSWATLARIRGEIGCNLPCSSCIFIPQYSRENKSQCSWCPDLCYKTPVRSTQKLARLRLTVEDKYEHTDKERGGNEARDITHCQTHVLFECS
jgi:hypothetical protein